MSDNWTDEELRAAVDVYVEMHQLASQDKSFIKNHYYDELAKRFGRTLKSYEYRMQNISYVYSLQGRQWLTGLKPARNVGVNIIKKLEQFIAQSEGQQLGASAAFEAKVAQLKGKHTSKPPSGRKSPQPIQGSVTYYVRDPAVVAWVLNEASGICECCGLPAPFQREDGSPYLEVHHVRRLADGGEDSIQNTVAICPNCHRALHYGLEKSELRLKLQAQVPRLCRSV